MPSPTISQVHINGPLTNISVAFLQSQRAYSATRVFQMVPVTKKSDNYFTFPREYWLANRARKRAPGARAAEGRYAISTDSYNTDREAMSYRIPDPIRANQDNPLNLDRQAALFVTQQILQGIEVDFASAFFGTSIWDTSITASNGNWDVDTSTPAKDVKTAKRTIITNTGLMDGSWALLLGAKVFDDLAEHPDFIDRIKGGATPDNPAVSDERQMAEIFGVDEVMVAQATRNTAAEEVAASYSRIEDAESALLVFRPNAPGLMTPAAGYTFVWGADGQANAETGMQIKRFRLPEAEESDMVEGNMYWDHKVVSSALGAFGNNLVSS